MIVLSFAFVYIYKLDMLTMNERTRETVSLRLEMSPTK